ncbi:DUF2332 domain-containing protein [Shimia abyssi]|uniref:DUF2332 family protein n=1 Tax=Shimia abyssi TaxID=1662395 RepID=A0A2P8FDK9_9RHOB|nr:DUF2332 family protein [Shimia abyssi]PSL19758.1 hypothetical protein CLV88_105181 [Shimia abyssi]
MSAAPSALRDAFLSQARSCEGMDSPFMGRLLRLLADHWPAETALAAKCAAWQGDIGPMAASLPLRICGGLHALVLRNQDAQLAAVYPPNTAPDDEFQATILAALLTHDNFLTDWISNAPQTNEVRRAAVLIPTAHLLADKFDLPLRLSELGASGGLNLMFDQFQLTLDGTTFGPASDVRLAPDWTGALPPAIRPKIADRRGVDLNPLTPTSDDNRLRLLAYLWPDQSDRVTRTRAAIALHDAAVDRADAIDWLGPRLAHQPGQVHLIYHTVAWQYFPPAVQARGTALIEAAGATASPEAPLAWLSYEADNASPGAGLTLRLWPGDITLTLGRVDFHGRWVDWQGPARLP